MTAFRVGQLVVCVDDEATIEPAPVVRGRVYTISEIVSDGCEAGGLNFIELPRRSGRPWFSWGPPRFRPVQYDTTKMVEEIKASLPRLKGRVTVNP